MRNEADMLKMDDFLLVVGQYHQGTEYMDKIVGYDTRILICQILSLILL